MGFFDRFKKKPEPKAKVEPKPKVPVKTEKEIATEKGEPYVAILSMQVDPENMHQGAFELDWNDKFVTNLIIHSVNQPLFSFPSAPLYYHQHFFDVMYFF